MCLQYVSLVIFHFTIKASLQTSSPAPRGATLCVLRHRNLPPNGRWRPCDKTKPRPSKNKYGVRQFARKLNFESNILSMQKFWEGHIGLTPRNQSGNSSKSLNMYVGMLGTCPPKQKKWYTSHRASRDQQNTMTLGMPVNQLNLQNIRLIGRLFVTS